MNHPFSQLIRAQLESLDDGGQQQLLRLTGLAGQTIGEAVRSQHFGMTSIPPAGAEFLMLALGGRHGRQWALGGEHPQHRPTGLKSGTVAVYDAGDNRVTLDGETVKVSHKATGNYTTIDKDGNVATHIADPTKQQHYLGGDPSKGGAFSPVATVAGPSPFAQARVA